MAGKKCRACGRTQQEHIDTPSLDHVFDMVLPSADFNTELKKTSHVAAAWETAIHALDYAIKEAALYGILTPSDPEVIMLRDFARNMQEREAGVIAALDAVRAALPKEYVVYGTPGRGTTRLVPSRRARRHG